MQNCSYNYNNTTNLRFIVEKTSFLSGLVNTSTNCSAKGTYFVATEPS